MALALNIVSHSEKETVAFGEKLAGSFKAGDVLILIGPVGGGKTAFVRGLAAGMGLDDALVTSPSFGIVNEYPGQLPLYHFDFYRLNSSSELSEVGWDEYLERPAIVAAEWGERADEYLPNTYYKIEFRIIDQSTREIDLTMHNNNV